MARIDIEDSLFTNARFIKLCVLLKSEIKAIGYFVKVARVAQSYWKHDNGLIPEDVYIFNKFPKELVDSTLVVKRDNGYYLHGSERSFAWISSKVKNGKKGGRPLQPIEIIEDTITYVETYAKATNNPISTSISTSISKSNLVNKNKDKEVVVEKYAATAFENDSTTKFNDRFKNSNILDAKHNEFRDKFIFFIKNDKHYFSLKNKFSKIYERFETFENFMDWCENVSKQSSETKNFESEHKATRYLIAAILGEIGER